MLTGSRRSQLYLYLGLPVCHARGPQFKGPIQEFSKGGGVGGGGGREVMILLQSVPNFLNMFLRVPLREACLKIVI